MYKRMIAVFIVLSTALSCVNTVFAVTKNNMTSQFYLSEAAYPDEVYKTVDNESWRSDKGGPVAYAEGYSNKFDPQGNKFSYGYYQRPLALENDSFDKVIPYMNYGSTTYSTVSGNSNRIMTRIASPARIEAGDGLYLSFYYRSKQSFYGAGDKENTLYEGNDASIYLIGFDHKRNNWHNVFQSLEGAYKLDSKADGEWHRIDLLTLVTEELAGYLDDPEYMEMIFGFGNLQDSYYIEFADFRVGVLKGAEGETYNFNRVITEIGWHLTNTKVDGLKVGGQEVPFVRGQTKYVVKSSENQGKIDVLSQSGALCSTEIIDDNEMKITIYSGIYDPLRSDDALITLRQRTNSAGEFSDSVSMQTYTVKNSDMRLGAYTVIVTEEEMENPLRTIPDSELFDGSPVYTKEEYQEWVNNGLPENMTQKVLYGNIAFVTESENYWHTASKKKATEAAAIEKDGEFYILSSLAQEIFGVTCGEKYIKVSNINSDYELFTDPRGFILFSHNMSSSIDKSSVKENDIGYRHYKSYYAVQMAIAEIAWDNIYPAESDYVQYISNWQDMVIMPADKMAANDAYIKSLAEKVSGYMSGINTSGSDFFTDNCDVYQKYARLFEMAKCYKTLKVSGRNDVDTSVLKNYTLQLLEHLYSTDFSKNVKLEPTTDWFNTLVTYPTRVGDTLMLMRDDISPENMTKYINTWNIILGDACVSKFKVPYQYDTHNPNGDVSNPCSNYTNLLWRTHASLRFAILERSDARVNRLLKYLNGIFEYTQTLKNSDIQMIRDGFYEDGSFIFHSYYAYNTGYGNSYAAELAELLVTTRDTVFDIRNLHNFDNVYSFVEKSWIPFIYKGVFSKFTSGRELPQSWGAISSAIMLILDSAPDEVKYNLGIKFKSQLGSTVNSYKYINNLPGGYYSMCYPALQYNINDFISYMDTLPDREETYSRVYYNMDRIIHKTNEFTFMLAMSSERTDRYEAINEAGYTDWYIGDGMTYVLRDTSQYMVKWWGGVDRYKMPGTTVDSTERNPLLSKYGNHNAENSYAGGVTDGKLTAAGMILPGNILETDSRLVGKKSYFMLGDKIVCLGSGITGGQGNVYTTVDNILMDRTNAPVNVDGKLMNTGLDVKTSYTGPGYIWFYGGYAYSFLGNNNVSVERVVNNKRYTGYDKTPGSNTDPFLTILIEHGSNPQNAKYGYVILPKYTNSEAAAYKSEDEFEVISQDNNMHAIRLLESGVIMANIFTEGELSGIRFNSPSSVIIKPYGNGYKVYASEPAQSENTVLMNVNTDKTISGAQQSGNNLTLEAEQPGATAVMEISDFSVEETESSYKVTVNKSYNGKVICAAYKNGTLISAKSESPAVFEKSAAPDTIKVFVWSDTGGIKPLKSAENLTFR